MNKEDARKDLDALLGFGPGGHMNFAYADSHFAISLVGEVWDAYKGVDYMERLERAFFGVVEDAVRPRTEGLALEDEVDDAYNEWCVPLINDSASNHPAVAFDAGYRAAIVRLAAEQRKARRTSEYWKAEHLAGNKEIVRLTAENDALRKALREIADLNPRSGLLGRTVGAKASDLDACQESARRALKGDSDE